MDKRDGEADWHLIQAYRQGESRAAEVLYQKYWPKVRDLSLQYMRTRDEAEDIAQEILLKVIVRKKIFGFRGQSQFWSWLYRITVNACKTQLQKKKRIHEAYVVYESNGRHGLPAFHHRDPETLAIQAERKKYLETALRQLEQKERWSISAVYLENRTYAETAQVLNVPLRTLGVQLMRTKAALTHWIRTELEAKSRSGSSESVHSGSGNRFLQGFVVC